MSTEEKSQKFLEVDRERRIVIRRDILVKYGGELFVQGKVDEAEVIRTMHDQLNALRAQERNFGLMKFNDLRPQGKYSHDTDEEEDEIGARKRAKLPSEELERKLDIEKSGLERDLDMLTKEF
ncbi:MAG: hypothetical protein WCW16_01930 [Candidatus Magasanikbacteria bacterium]